MQSVHISEKEWEYEAALYLRLSKDDTDTDGNPRTESDSIGNQRELLQNFVKGSPDIRIFDIYADDGYSGVNFDRPEFRRMTKDIESGKVNCVIVKDLSRFGREYIEAGRWIQKIYPALNVRFIAVTDHYDSKTADDWEKSLMVPVKNFINDSYCRDISVKVRSQQQMKREKGAFIGAFAPYGYVKDPENRNRLVPDQYAGNIVRRIFAWKMEGLSLRAIARKLNDAHILPPKEYKRSAGMNYNSGFEGTGMPRWSAAQIRRILTNEMYTGTMVQGKQERISYKMKKRLDKPEQEWVKVKHTHPALISPGDYEIVRKLMKYGGRLSGETDIFSGILFCGDCRAPMVRRVNQSEGKKKIFYICRTKNKGEGCTRHSIPEETLKRIVLDEIRNHTGLLLHPEALRKELEKLEVGNCRSDCFDAEISRLQEKYDQYCSFRAGLYEDWKEGIISREEFYRFREIYRAKCEELLQTVQQQKKYAKQISGECSSAAEWPEEWKNFCNLGELDRMLLILTVDRILIYENRRIVISLRCRDESGKMKAGKNRGGRNVRNAGL